MGYRSQVVRGSTTSNRQTANNNQQPATGNQQPATSNQQPATSNQQPRTSNQQPATGNQCKELGYVLQVSTTPTPATPADPSFQGIRRILPLRCYYICWVTHVWDSHVPTQGPISHVPAETLLRDTLLCMLFNFDPKNEG